MPDGADGAEDRWELAANFATMARAYLSEKAARYGAIAVARLATLASAAELRGLLTGAAARGR